MGSKSNGKFRGASRAFNVSGARAAFHTQIAMTSRTGNLYPWDLFFEREIRVAGTTFQLRWAVVDPGDQHLRARRTGDFLFLPFPSSQRVINAHPCITKVAGKFTQAHRQHAIAFRAGEWRWDTLDSTLNSSDMESLLFRIKNQLFRYEVPRNIQRESKFF